ncbi:MAG: hypothetical protein BWY76_01653 [bacterium ADurb.Bin429]|nr:MAG: hypothetical protein BWY76_01653 [bacterium ADurb.Bin429]
MPAAAATLTPTVRRVAISRVRSMTFISVALKMMTPASATEKASMMRKKTRDCSMARSTSSRTSRVMVTEVMPSTR